VGRTTGGRVQRRAPAGDGGPIDRDQGELAKKPVDGLRIADVW
jgi:hypothetical protein